MRTREGSGAERAEKDDRDDFVLRDRKVGVGPTKYSPGHQGKTSEKALSTREYQSCEPKEKLPLYVQGEYKRF